MSKSAPCREYVAQLHSYVDGELTHEERDALRAHLESCPPCLDEYERDAMLKALVRRSCPCEQAPATLRASVMSLISVQVLQVEIRD